MNRLLALATGTLALSIMPLGFAAEGPAVGSPAPEFELPDQTGQLHSLEDYRDQWVVLYFYPKDETPGCTTEACEFRDNIFAFRDLNAQILGVSLDDVDSHREFAENHSLPFPLLADVDHAVSEAYGVWKEKKLYGRAFMGIERSTFLIGEDGVVEQVWRKVQAKGHTEMLAELLGA